MKPHIRHTIAYIAGRLITGKASLSLYDYSAGKYVFFTGSVEGNNISLYDHDRCAHIKGDLGNIHFYGDGCGVKVDIRGSNFDGYDFCGSGHFTGNAYGNLVCIYDYASAGYFNYLI